MSNNQQDKVREAMRKNPDAGALRFLDYDRELTARDSAEF
jgi:hypothetical protein